MYANEEDMMISEELLLSSILVPKKRLPLTFSSRDSNLSSDTKPDSRASSGDAMVVENRLRELQDKVIGLSMFIIKCSFSLPSKRRCMMRLLKGQRPRPIR